MNYFLLKKLLYLLQKAPTYVRSRRDHGMHSYSQFIRDAKNKDFLLIFLNF